MSEMNWVLRDLEAHERQTRLQEQSRRQRIGEVEDRERRWHLLRLHRHSS